MQSGSNPPFFTLLFLFSASLALQPVFFSPAMPLCWTSRRIAARWRRVQQAPDILSLAKWTPCVEMSGKHQKPQDDRF